MNAKTSRKTYWYQAKAETVIDLLRTFNPQVAPALAQRYAPEIAENESPVDWAFNLELDVRHLETLVASALVADHERGEAIEQRVASREARDIQDSALRGGLLAVKDRISRHHGFQSVRRFGFGGPLPEQAAALVSFAREVQRRLRDPEVELPPARLGLAEVRRSQEANNLQPLIQGAQNGVAGFIAFSAKAHEALVTKQAQQEELRKCFVHTLRHMESTYRLAGFDEFAERLRLALRNVGPKKKRDSAPSTRDDQPEGGRRNLDLENLPRHELHPIRLDTVGEDDPALTHLGDETELGTADDKAEVEIGSGGDRGEGLADKPGQSGLFRSRHLGLDRTLGNDRSSPTRRPGSGRTDQPGRGMTFHPVAGMKAVARGLVRAMAHEKLVQRGQGLAVFAAGDGFRPVLDAELLALS